jgi:hypothetical protein
MGTNIAALSKNKALFVSDEGPMEYCGYASFICNQKESDCIF